jgi:hypothetical protein
MSGGGRDWTVTENAVQGSTDEASSPIFRRHPRPNLPGRIVPHVLGMAALEFGNPMLLIILVESNDSPFHQPGSLRSM